MSCLFLQPLQQPDWKCWCWIPRNRLERMHKAWIPHVSMKLSTKLYPIDIYLQRKTNGITVWVDCNVIPIWSSPIYVHGVILQCDVFAYATTANGVCLHLLVLPLGQYQCFLLDINCMHYSLKSCDIYALTTDMSSVDLRSSNYCSCKQLVLCMYVEIKPVHDLVIYSECILDIVVL